VEPSAQRARVRTQHLPHNRKRPSDQPKSLGGGGVSATQVALDIAAASLGVSVVSVAAAARIRSGSRLRALLTWTEHPQDQLKDVMRIEVHNTGRQPAVLRYVILGKRLGTADRGGGRPPGGRPRPTFEYGLYLFPTRTEHRRTIAPADFAVFEVPFGQVRDQWGEQGKLPLQALITWGRGKASHSKVIRIKTSGRVP
jgi:hypothetical protein